MTIGKDGIERDPVRIGKCYACAYTFHIWICPTCEGPYIEAACQICHNERKHGVMETPRDVKMGRARPLDMNFRSARTTARGAAFGETKTGWAGREGKSRRKHK